MGELGARVDEMLAVVEHDQYMRVAKGARERLSHRPRLRADPDRGGHRAGHERGIRQRCELDQPDAIHVVLKRLARGPQRQTRLA